MKKLTLILLSILMIMTLAAYSDKCEHTYDNDCDATCNDCGEIREVSAHDYAAATCTAPKTCSVCGATDGNALGHTPADDDGDCTTEVKCAVCGDVTTPAKTNHIAHADDNNCLTAVTCTACDTVMVEAKTAHDLSGEWLSDGDGHWHVCKNDGCTVIPDKTEHTPETDDGNCTTAQKCTVCGQTAVDAKSEHTDTDGDFLCDNAGCQVTVGTPPKDENEGIDLPIDWN